MSCFCSKPFQGTCQLISEDSILPLNLHQGIHSCRCPANNLLKILGSLGVCRLQDFDLLLQKHFSDLSSLSCMSFNSKPVVKFLCMFCLGIESFSQLLRFSLFSMQILLQSCRVLLLCLQ